MASDAVMISVVTAIVTLLGTIFTLVQAYLIARLNAVKKVVDDVHILTNSNLSAQMQATSTAMQVGLTALKRIAEDSKKSTDIEAVAIAEKALLDQLQQQKKHEENQAVVDSKIK